jgi:hypothetical protein
MSISSKKLHSRSSFCVSKLVGELIELAGREIELAGRETQEIVDSSNAAGMEGMESIAKTLAAEDEDIWMELQYFRDHSHCKEVYAKMMTDKILEPLLNEFFGLTTQGRGLITGGFNRLKH